MLTVKKIFSKNNRIRQIDNLLTFRDVNNETNYTSHPFSRRLIILLLFFTASSNSSAEEGEAAAKNAHSSSSAEEGEVKTKRSHSSSSAEEREVKAKRSYSSSSAEEIEEAAKKETKCIIPRCLPKWEGHLTLDLKAGNYRRIIQPIIFMPILQNEISMLFLDLRGMTDTTSALEGNVALAYRRIHDNWIFGGYGFFDRRRTQFGNLFSQLTFGVEALNPLWEARFNSYFPITPRKIIHSLTNIVRQSRASGYSRTITTTNNTFFDTPLGGFDTEVGYEFFKDFRLLLGVYQFKGKGVSTINGARLRFAYDVVKHEGIKFTLQGETQHDAQRKGIHYIGFRLVFPIGDSRHIRQEAKFTPIEKMMTHDIVRDVDIVSIKKGERNKGEKNTLIAKEVRESQEERKTIFVELVDGGGGGDIPGDGTAESPYLAPKRDYDKPAILQMLAGGGGHFDDIAIINDGGGQKMIYHPIANIPTIPAAEIAAIHAPPPAPPAAPALPGAAPAKQPRWLPNGHINISGKKMPVFKPNPNFKP